VIFAEFVTEVMQVLFVEAAFKERAGIDAG